MPRLQITADGQRLNETQHAVPQHAIPKTQHAIPKTEFLKKTFGYSGAILWNSLPQDVKSAESITSFRTMAKLHLSR